MLQSGTHGQYLELQPSDSGLPAMRFMKARTASTGLSLESWTIPSCTCQATAPVTVSILVCVCVCVCVCVLIHTLTDDHWLTMKAVGYDTVKIRAERAEGGREGGREGGSEKYKSKRSLQ